MFGTVISVVIFVNDNRTRSCRIPHFTERTEEWAERAMSKPAQHYTPAMRNAA